MFSVLCLAWSRIWLEKSHGFENARAPFWKKGKNQIDDVDRRFPIGGTASFAGTFDDAARVHKLRAIDIFPVFVSCGIHSGLGDSRDLKNARTPFVPEPLGGGGTWF